LASVWEDSGAQGKAPFEGLGANSDQYQLSPDPTGLTQDLATDIFEVKRGETLGMLSIEVADNNTPDSRLDLNSESDPAKGSHRLDPTPENQNSASQNSSPPRSELKPLNTSMGDKSNNDPISDDDSDDFFKSSPKRMMTKEAVFSDKEISHNTPTKSDFDRSPKRNSTNMSSSDKYLGLLVPNTSNNSFEHHKKITTYLQEVLNFGMNEDLLGGMAKFLLRDENHKIQLKNLQIFESESIKISNIQTANIKGCLKNFLDYILKKTLGVNSEIFLSYEEQYPSLKAYIRAFRISGDLEKFIKSSKELLKEVLLMISLSQNQATCTDLRTYKMDPNGLNE
jgi:hypothetical protein